MEVGNYILVVTYNSSDGPRKRLEQWFPNVNFESTSIDDHASEPSHIYPRLDNAIAVIFYIPSSDPKSFTQLIHSHKRATQLGKACIITHENNNSTVRKALPPRSNTQVVYFNRTFLETFVTKYNNSLNNQATDELTIFPIKEAISNLVRSGMSAHIFKAESFWYELLRAKFDQFMNYDGITTAEIASLNNAWIAESGTIDFLSFLNRQSRPEVVGFLELLGQVIAYIDENAGNKTKWNEYEDKRTIAKTGVRMGPFVRALFNIKLRNSVSSQSVINAVAYITNPEFRFPILSEDHRSQIWKNIFNTPYRKSQFDSELHDWFKTFQIDCVNQLNFTAGCMKILYHPSVRSLWKKSVEEPDEYLDALTDDVLDKQAKYDFTRSLLQVSGHFHSDELSKTDELLYRPYAESIARILKGSKTHPPMNIAIIAPWGHGKSTIMNFIRMEFESEDRWSVKKSFLTQLTNGHVKDLLKSLTASVDTLADKLNNAESNNKSSVDKGVLAPNFLEYPTVWFNPWKYQSSDQIWAGIGHAIITQLVGKFEPLEQEKIWFKLRLRRTDVGSIRRELHKKALNYILPLMLFILIGGFALFSLTPLLWAVIGSILICISGGIGFCALIKKINLGLVQGKLWDAVQEPDYINNVGLFHCIEQDLKMVVDELVDKQHPAIIFIDDLDRCSPRTISHVFEAINLIMTSDIKDRCFFIIGMDAPIIAAALDTEYTGWAGKLNYHEKQYGSVGWYFLDKFIQMPFVVPSMNDGKRDRMIRKLFGNSSGKSDENGTVTNDQVSIDVKRVFDMMKDNKSSIQQIREVVSSNYQDSYSDFRRELTGYIVENTQDDPELISQALQFGSFLGESPREIKRFVNLLRFYYGHQQARRLDPMNNELDFASTFSLAKWLIISLKWPQLVRWLQWEKENVLAVANSPLDKAAALDRLIEDSNSNYEHWESTLNEKLSNDQDRNRFKWLYDRILYKILSEYNSDDMQLVNAIKYDVW